MVHQDAPHRLGREREEVRAVAQADAGRVHQPDVRLVDQGRRLERVVRALAAEVLLGEGAQPVVDERQQVLRGLRVSCA
jgi:hypothetical protein